MRLVWPAPCYLAGYVSALARGWSPDNLRGAAAAREELALIASSAARFLDSQVDRQAKGPPVTSPDGSQVPRLPGFRRWLWDGEFCGSIGLHWVDGGGPLPAHVLGHIGYAVVPWKQGRGYAREALRQILVDAWAEGLPHVELTTDPANLPSQRVILANGGRLLGPCLEPAQYGGREGLRFRIDRPEAQGQRVGAVPHPLPGELT
jgi:predicted acetyltransferase